MNSVSVTGKNWILKNFDQEQIVFIKEIEGPITIDNGNKDTKIK